VVTGQWLVDALVARLSAIVPARFAIESSRGLGVQVRDRDDDLPFGLIKGVAEILDQPGELAEHVEDAAYSVLSGVQDFIAETLTVPWPGEREMPLPFACVRDGFLHMGFGSEHDPVVLFQAIPVPS
jgi:hypothetical protein